MEFDALFWYEDVLAEKKTPLYIKYINKNLKNKKHIWSWQATWRKLGSFSYPMILPNCEGTAGSGNLEVILKDIQVEL